MVVQQEILERTSRSTEDINKTLQWALRCLDIEGRWQTSNVHLLSTDSAQVESLLIALDQLIDAQKAIQKYLEGETDPRTADRLLKELIANAMGLRKQLWPYYYRACEALTRMLDVLTRIERSLSVLN